MCRAHLVYSFEGQQQLLRVFLILSRKACQKLVMLSLCCTTQAAAGDVSCKRDKRLKRSSRANLRRGIEHADRLNCLSTLFVFAIVPQVPRFCHALCKIFRHEARLRCAKLQSRDRQARCRSGYWLTVEDRDDALKGR